MSSTTLKVAVCLFNGVTNLDYEGPLELFSFLSADVLKFGFITSPIVLEPTYFAYSREPFRGSHVGPLITPDRVYDELKDGEQFDIILVPGGWGSRPEVVQPSLLEFLKRQVPGAKYVFSVCTGAWLLAQAGLLNGKRATTSKALFKLITEKTKDQPIEWVPKARWVVDGNLWTSSGVTAGIDMAHAFLSHLVGDKVVSEIRGHLETNAREAGDDDFAKAFGLV